MLVAVEVLVVLVGDFMFGSLWVGDFDDGRYGCVKELFRGSSALTDWEVVVVCQPSPCLEVTNWLDCVTNTIREHEIAEQSSHKICVVHKVELVTLGPYNAIQIVAACYDLINSSNASSCDDIVRIRSKYSMRPVEVNMICMVVESPLLYVCA